MFDFGKVHYVSLFKLDESITKKVNGFITSSGKRLLQSVQNHNGHVCYLGRVVEVFHPTPQFQSNDFDLVSHSNWHDRVSFETRRSELYRTETIQDHKFQQFHRPVLKNLFMTIMIHGVVPTLLGVKANLLGAPYDLSPAEEPEVPITSTSGEDRSFCKLHSLHRLASKLEETGKDVDQPILWWNWEVDVQGSEFWDNLSYGLKFVPMLTLNGGGGVHGGSALGGDGEFDRMLAVYYPSRRFVAQMLRSNFFYGAVQNKNPGTGISLITVPYSVPFALP